MCESVTDRVADDVVKVKVESGPTTRQTAATTRRRQQQQQQQHGTAARHRTTDGGQSHQDIIIHRIEWKTTVLAMQKRFGILN